LNDQLIKNADIWDVEPKLLAADLEYCGIQALSSHKSNIIKNGGIWNIISTPDASKNAYTFAGDVKNIANSYGYTTYKADSMTICFSQPVLPSTVNPTTFEITLNTGNTVTPHVASIVPNVTFNTASCITIFGQFGNRIAPGILGAIYPTKVSIIEGHSNGATINLTLIGLNNVLTNMTGKSINSYSSYAKNNGPKILAAKISVTSNVGENTLPFFNEHIPNDGISLYPL
jgi:hypothetical protein